MARLGRRERLEKRKRLEALAALALSRKEAARKECQALKALPKRERNLLQGRGKVDVNDFRSYADYIGNFQHTNTLRLGSNLEKTSLPYKSGDGVNTKWSKALPSGSGLDFSGNRPKGKPRKKSAQGPRFAPAFMAPGYEYLASNEPGRDTVEILVPPETRFRKV